MDIINILISENEGLIYRIINKYKNYFEIDDLYQVAVIGIIKAYNNYRQGYNAKFSSYAYPYILGEVLKYINEFRTIKTNKSMNMLYSKILKAKEILSQRLMKEPSIHEIASFLEIDESIIDEVLLANDKIDSLDRIISEDGKDFELYNRYGYLEDGVENYPLLYELEKLSMEEKQIIISRYYEDMSQKEVGDALGMYQVEVSRKEKRILKKLKDNISA